MNNIAIFGDSFSARMYTETPPTAAGFLKEIYALCNRNYNKKEIEILKNNWGKRYTPWVDLLDADVYGHSGSDLYYSYNQFIKNHKNYDKCVFVITSPYRISTNINGWLHCASYEDAVEKIKFSTSAKMKLYFTNLADYFKNVYYQDLEKPMLIHQAMLDSITLLRPDTLFINAYPDLKNVYDLELDAWNMTHDESQDYKKYFDLRQCHMTIANNKILAKHILDNLDKSGVLELSSVKWKIPNTEDCLYHLPNTKDLFVRLL
tara:strand:- start:152 stop:937 length:786 start_codon:yes stop_codon:yes gene_type:complete